MATAELNVQNEAEMHDVHEHHESHGNFWTNYVFSLDHKVIAKQFLISGIFWALIGGGLSLIFRLQLGFPEASLEFLRPILGDWITPEGQLHKQFYLAAVTMHGTIMVFFVLTAGLSGTFSNLLIPLQIGARDMASGFMNMLSYWFFFLSSVVMFVSLFVSTGPASGGWVVYPPLSALPQAIDGSGLGMTLWLVSMSLFIVSSLLGSVNYIATVVNMRTAGLSFGKLPLTIWAFFITAIIGILSFPVLFAAALLLVFDRSFGTSFYLSDIYIDGVALHHSGGSPILYQHLFWFLGHPEVYIVLLPALGLTSEVISTNSRKPIFGYKAMIGSMLGIAFLSFIVWAHHMFVSGMNPFLGTIFMLLTLIIAVPSAVKAFNYITTMFRGNIVFTPAMLFSIGLVSLFISGGVTGIVLGNSALDIQLHDTYFVVAHFHLVMGSAAFFGMMAGVYHWFPKMFGRMINEKLGYVHFWMTFVGAYLVFFPMHYIGIAGFPRRYYTFTRFDAFSTFTDLNQFISIAAILTVGAQLLFVFNFFYSMFKGRRSPQNPWGSTTLEWTTPVNVGHGNWPGKIPTVYRWPYDFSKPGSDEDGFGDFIPQHIPYSQTPASNTEEEKPLVEIEKELDALNTTEHDEIH
ncbi:cytochrome c oxidase subunit I [Sediminitomix flava]|uniref:Cytochrome c oxidase subunit 1 n=1 Tax=Sediminitomix flava TaxID=379075 RepID=A0A315ZBV9_SEDFL|nr:cbb3-type cytochrome c oxidase subunit I [Sediminitomix flava]PWJ42649.1 cytochrome c oxidase subunit 1 [Sediminitomix flava]